MGQTRENKNGHRERGLLNISTLNKDTAYKRDSSSPSLSRNCCLQDFNQYGGLCEQGEGKAVILFPDILCDVRPLFPATFTKFSLIKLGKPLSYVISFRMQEMGVFSDLENLNLAPTTSLRKHPFLLALRRWGRFARRNVCDSATEIPY